MENKVKKQKTDEIKLDKKEHKEVEKLQNEINSLQEKIKELTTLVNMYEPSHKKLMVYSLDANRLKAEKEELAYHKKFAARKFLEEILDPLELFEKVVKAADNADGAVKQWAYGFRMILNQFNDVLAKEHVKQIPIKIGEIANGEFHHAIEEVIAPDRPPGSIVEVLKNGYTMHDKVIKHALVKVAKATDDNKSDNLKGETNE